MITVEQFTKYATRKNCAHYSRIPIAELNDFRSAFARYGVYYKVRYRGPRTNVPSAFFRSKASRQATCLKEDATHFSAYLQR